MFQFAPLCQRCVLLYTNQYVMLSVFDSLSLYTPLPITETAPVKPIHLSGFIHIKACIFPVYTFHFCKVVCGFKGGEFDLREAYRFSPSTVVSCCSAMVEYCHLRIVCNRIPLCYRQAGLILLFFAFVGPENNI